MQNLRKKMLEDRALGFHPVLGRSCRRGWCNCSGSSSAIVVADTGAKGQQVGGWQGGKLLEGKWGDKAVPVLCQATKLVLGKEKNWVKLR
jgi:hypothetical protein|eukprot:evm.model.NODE_18784_length_12911_cov_19.438231.3